MINGSNNNNNNSFAKTICSICYEDLKPIVEDLQSISICGHVFHELCLQQWFEYCSSTKKCTCPVCKQGCKAKDASRLYFQSIGDCAAADPSLTQRLSVLSGDEDPEALRREVRRLEAKVIGLDSAVERQGKDLKELNLELCLCKELGKKETALRNEALKEKALLQQLLRVKTEELDKSSLECLRLQERSLALAKELASIKLVSDLDLCEEEVLKLASFGNGGKNQDTIDILRKSLVMRNRSYKELMAKCNALGRGESRSTKKLEKAKEKISRLKERVKELEIAAEVKDNEVLRELKGSKKITWDVVNTNPAQNKVPENKSKQGFEPRLKLDPLESLQDDPSRPLYVQNCKLANDNIVHHILDGPKTMTRNEEKNSCSLIDAHLSKSLTDTHGLQNSDSKLETTEDLVVLKSTLHISNATSSSQKEPLVGQHSNLAGGFSSRTNVDKATNNGAVDFDDDVIVLLDDAAQVKPIINIRKESCTSQSFSSLGDTCFSSGLLGPDGTSRYLGKWCKRGQNKETRQDVSTSSTRNLISVGADGRGGRIKVLRSLNQSSLSLDSKETTVGTKRLKLGGKSNGQPSRGCLQIEHFFGRVSH